MTTGVEVTPTGTIGVDEIEAITVGAAFYASGGGGSLVEGRALAAEIAGRIGSSPIALVSLDALPDAARVASPTTHTRPGIPASIDAATMAVRSLGHRTGGDFDAILPADLGPHSTLIALAVAAELDVAVVDAAGAARAAGHLDQTTWAAAGVHPPVTVFSDGRDSVTIENESIELADRSRRAILGGETFRGSVGCASWPMRAPTARRSSLPATLSAACEAGQAVLAAITADTDPVGELVRVADGAVLVGSGRVGEVVVALHERSEHFEIRIDTDLGPIDVVSVESHVLLRIGERLLAGAPDLITVVTDTGMACTPRDLAAPAMHGHPVAVVAAPSPRVGSIGVDASSFATALRAAGGTGEPVPFTIS